MIFELIGHSQKGDEELTLQLIEKFKPLLLKYRHKLQYEDAYYDLLVDYLEILQNIHVDNFECKNDGKAVSYLATSIYDSYVKRLKQTILLPSICLYSELSAGQQISLGAIASTNDQYLKCYFECFQNELTAIEYYTVVSIFYSGYTANELVNIFNTFRQAINQAKIRGLTRIKKLYSPRLTGVTK